MSSEVGYKDKKQLLFSVFSGTLLAIASTLIMILLFALIIRFFNISDNFIFPINQVIKVISLFLGILIVLKKQGNKGFLKGIFLGMLYYILSTIVFSILQGSFSFRLNNLLDLLLTILIGGIIGIIVVNIKKRWLLVV